LVYQECRTCEEAVLVLDGGEQLRLSSGVGLTLFSYSLSPDGRWLTMPDPTGAVLRDLTGDQSYVIETVSGRVLSAWAWSPDSRWALLSEASLTLDGGAAPTGYRLVDMVDGADTEVTLPIGEREFVAVLPSGQLVAMDVARGESGDESGPAVTAVDVELTDPFGSEQDVTFTIDARDWLDDDETLADSGFTGRVQLIHAPGEDGYLLTVFGTAGPAGVLQVEPDGHVRDRLELDGVKYRRVWRIAGHLGGELMAAHSRATSDAAASSWILYAVVDDDLREVATLASAYAVRLPGTAAHGGSMF
jgi:hypothetical protein